MKKFFLFAAAAIAALTVNAKVLDLTTEGTTIAEWTINEATMNSESVEADGKYYYDIKANVASESFVTAEPNIVFQIKNGSDKNKAFTVYPGKCYEFGGKNGILVLKGTAVGDKILLTVAAKGSTDANFEDTAEEPQYPKNAKVISEDLVLPAKSAVCGSCCTSGCKSVPCGIYGGFDIIKSNFSSSISIILSDSSFLSNKSCTFCKYLSSTCVYI